MKSLLLLLLVFVSNDFNKVIVKPIEINAQPKTFFYGKCLTSHILIIFNRFSISPSNKSGMVFVGIHTRISVNKI